MSKRVLAQDMIERSLEAGLPFGWVTADEFHGQDTKFRLWLEIVDVAHVVSVPTNATVVSMDLRKVRVSRLISLAGEADADAAGTRPAARFAALVRLVPARLVGLATTAHAQQPERSPR